MDLQTASKWQNLNYRGIPANRVEFGESGLKIDVDKSASPIIYPLSAPTKLQHIDLSLEVQGELNLGEKKQGGEGADDFRFRLGVVFEGSRTLNFMERMIAAKWVTTLYDLAPKGTGVSHIEFFNLFDDSRLKGKQRRHPLTDHFIERFVIEPQSSVEYRVSLPEKSPQVLALWISCDGDDTQSKFSVLLKKLTLVP